MIHIFPFIKLLVAIRYSHKRQISHNNISPFSIYIDQDTCVKIKSFKPLTRFRGKPRHDTEKIDENMFRFVNSYIPYLSPEALLCEGVYDDHRFYYAQDLWAVGCLLAEFFFQKPIFSARSEQHQQQRTRLGVSTGPPLNHQAQLRRIVQLIGTGSDLDFITNTTARTFIQGLGLRAASSDGTYGAQPGLLWRYLETAEFDLINRIHFKSSPAPSSRASEGGWDRSVDLSLRPDFIEDNPLMLLHGLHLIKSLLRFHPLERLSAVEAIRHPFFSTFLDLDDVLDRGVFDDEVEGLNQAPFMSETAFDLECFCVRPLPPVDASAPQCVWSLPETTTSAFMSPSITTRVAAPRVDEGLLFGWSTWEQEQDDVAAVLRLHFRLWRVVRKYRPETPPPPVLRRHPLWGRRRGFYFTLCRMRARQVAKCGSGTNFGTGIRELGKCALANFCDTFFVVKVAEFL